ncbi:uncharacterized protein BJ171DRAFT_419564 [Polychytrium aggregatum]|uniref:uncharacterized protein n=1 Tax=Polychytrium aggregatum TaxID=110093 RepID=UPI0022FDB129|nr:uncharacterized protein BJ171DRAFT_419564 [Polychytrium aggregatum]KAI9208613.1 hypothetical protein BJ171DRAFT_419564 [Polychytrium aggregatum]
MAASSDRSSTGLFGYDLLSHPSGFVEAAEASIAAAVHLVDLVCSVRTEAEMVKTVQRLDRLSDVLCAVIDCAELVRNVHPDPRVVESANHAHAILANFLNQLNTHQGLYRSLKRVVETPSVFNQLSREEQRVATLLIVDFEKSGISMDDGIRQKFVELNDQILQLGQDFIMDSAPSQKTITLDASSKAVEGIPKRILDTAARSRFSKTFSINTQSSSAYTILKSAQSEETRKKVYMALNSGSRRQIDRLEALLKTRAKLAQFLGKKSYAEMFLVDKMAGTPANVLSFLESLTEQHKHKAQHDIAKLQKLKAVHTGQTNPVINAWDRIFYSQFIAPVAATAKPGGEPFHPTAQHVSNDTLAPYFSVGRTFEGLSSVFQALYGVSLQPVAPKPGEAWHKDVRKLDVIHERDGKIGTIYCDLFARESGAARKYESAAHFTVRCSRLTSNDESCRHAGRAVMQNRAAEREFSRTVELPSGATETRTFKYQLPIVVLVTSFSRPSNNVPSLLSLGEVETLFHELGHAMHSMLGRTDFQHIAGTRCSIDFVEVPSIFMEYLARDPRVLQKFAFHYKTGEPLPLGLLESYQLNQSALESLEVHQQLWMAILDQLYHSTGVLDPGFSTTKILQELTDRIHVIPFTPGTAWQVQFSHLFSYGASYYSYLWCRLWASRIWNTHFEGKEVFGPEWRQNGELIRRELLQWGGGRDPWVGLENMGIVKAGEREGRTLGELSDLRLYEKP